MKKKNKIKIVKIRRKMVLFFRDFYIHFQNFQKCWESGWESETMFRNTILIENGTHVY